MAENNPTTGNESIAIVGMAGKFPGANSLDQFWRNLVQGVDSISRFSTAELEYSVSTADAIAQGQRFVRARGILKDADLFDAEFFGMYPKEAQLIDPQHRLFLECAWEALENAGHAPDSYPGLIGVYAGLSMNTYLLHNLCKDRAFAANFSANYQVDSYSTMLGNDKDFMPTRVSYKLDLRGPSMTIQTACSTSLVAVCQACTSLLTYQCDMALAGGVSITFPQKRDYRYQEDGIVSADGSCRSFDADACGTVFGHGVAVVLLKRLEDAVSDGDSILAIIKGFAVNNDGSDKIGYAAPSVNAQADVVATAQAAANVHPDSVSYVEAHGTATPLGDPIEVAALTAAFRRGGASRNQYCALGTGKTNVGHLDIAAGATGLIKTVLQLQHEFIPPLLHFKAENPKIDFRNSPFYPISQPTVWKRGEVVRRAGVSALGIGGTNAHVVVEESPSLPPSGPSRKSQLLLLSAKTPTALSTMSKHLAEYLHSRQEVSFADVAFTLQRGRQRFRHRLAVCAASAGEAVERLNDTHSKSTFIAQAPGQSPSLVFLFPGQGAQYVNMGRDLYENEPVFRNSVDRCADSLRGHLQFDIRSVLYPRESAKAEADQRINETRVTQPAIFTVEYALASLWTAWGIGPSLLIGHSVGEYVAAVLAGVFSLEDALQLLAGRAKLMQELPPGSMLAVRRGVADLEVLLPAGVAVAAINSPSLTTLSGPTPLLRALQDKFEASGIVCRLLPTSHAFHSAMMDPIVERFKDLASGVLQQNPAVPWISTLTGTWINDQAPPESSYCAAQLRNTVRFGDAIETAIRHGATAFLELGPGQALTQLVRQQPLKTNDLTLLSSLGTSDANPADLESMLTCLGRLWLVGIEPDWNGFYSAENRRRLPLPTYPFERKSYWIEAPEPSKHRELSMVSDPPDGKRGENGESATGQGEAVPEFAPMAYAAPSGASLSGDTRSHICRVIEKQVQLMAQQMETLRRRAVAGRSDNGDK